ncbi:MAG TPA: hypothetical protein VMV18_12950, partial [bacterium]|nr:hypothetical protein [bacterium]
MGLRTYIVGHAIDAAVKRLAARPELEIVPVDDAGAIVARVDGSEPAIVILPVKDVDEELATIAALVSHGAQVVVVAANENPGLRVAAFSAGVSDVIFPPYQDWFVEESVMALAGNPLRKDVRVPAQMEALLVPIGMGAALAGNLVSLSMGELRARVSGSLPPGAVLRVALKPPRPHRLPVLFARATRAETLEDGRLEVRARFAGMTTEEQQLLGKYLEQQPAEVEDLAGVLAAIEHLDVPGLRNVAGKTLGSLSLPPLTELELAWLRAAPATADAALAEVALARVRAELASSVLEAVGADLVGLAGLPVARYRE